MTHSVLRLSDSLLYYSQSLTAVKSSSLRSVTVSSICHHLLPPPPTRKNDPPSKNNLPPKTLIDPKPPSPQNPNLNPDDKDKPVVVNKQSNHSILGKKPDYAAKVAELKSRIYLLKTKPSNFDPKSVANWGKGEKVPFVFLALVFDMISNESGRIVMTDIACNVFRTVIETALEDLVLVTYLPANRIAPPHEGIELGIGNSIINKAIAKACGKTEAQIKKQNKEMGDLGLVAMVSRSSQSVMRQPDPLTIAKVFDTFKLIAKESGKDSVEKKRNRIKSLLVAATDCEPLYLVRLLQVVILTFNRNNLVMRQPDPLTIAKVFDTFKLIAKESGKDSVEKKRNRIKSLLVAATDCEPLYLVRLLQGKLRIGLAEQTLLAALGQAAVYNEEHSKAPANIQSPLEEVYGNVLKHVALVLVFQLDPMLAKPAKGVAEIVNKFHDMEYTCEYKYDGERAQIHYLENGTVEIYSRNAERNTGKFPDVIETVCRLKKPTVKSFVLDCELVAYDRKLKKLETFQKLSTRPRKNVKLNEVAVHVCIFPFDMLYFNGKPLLREQLKARREEPGFLQFATNTTSNDVEEIPKFFYASVGTSCEGLIVKTLNKDATYEPSKQSNNWVKLKKDYMDSFGDSLDLFILLLSMVGVNVQMSGAFLLACYDNNNEEYQSICKIGTGFSEAMLEERSASLRAQVIPNPRPYYRFDPTEVWEVKAADLTISPVYRAAIGTVDCDKGISLRFPRLVRVREDKSPEQAPTSEQVAELYNAQSHNHQTNQNDEEDGAAHPLQRV